MPTLEFLAQIEELTEENKELKEALDIAVNEICKKECPKYQEKFVCSGQCSFVLQVLEKYPHKDKEN